MKRKTSHIFTQTERDREREKAFTFLLDESN